LTEQGLPQRKPTKLYVDNQGAVELSKDQKSCHRSRHVLRRYFKVRELQHDGVVEVVWVATDDNLADGFTKPLGPAKFTKFKSEVMNTGASSVADVAMEKRNAPLEEWAAYLGVDPAIATYEEYVAMADGAHAASEDSCEPVVDRPHWARRLTAKGAQFQLDRMSEAVRRKSQGVERPDDETWLSSVASRKSILESIANGGDKERLDGFKLMAEYCKAGCALTKGNTSFVETYQTGIDGQDFAFASVDPDDDPSYNRAVEGPESAQWDDAMGEEIKNLERFGVFEPWPEDKCPGWNGRFSPHVTETLWVLKRKRGAKNEVTKHKARCVYNDKRRLNRALVDTFSPAVRHSTIRTAMAVACIKRRKVFAFDVTGGGAYLQGRYRDDEDPVYARPPLGRRTKDSRGVPIVWKMHRPLYGQGDAGRIWYRTLREQLVGKQKFVPSECDPSYFYKRYKP